MFRSKRRNIHKNQAFNWLLKHPHLDEKDLKKSKGEGASGRRVKARPRAPTRKSEEAVSPPLRSN